MLKWISAAAIGAALCSVSAAAGAAVVTVTVTSPTGVFTNPGAVNAGDPLVADTWLRTNVRNGGAAGITTDYARSGNGSAMLSGPNNAKADFEYYFSQPFSLSSVSSLSYQWYRNSSSTAAAHLHPSLRLFVDADGNLGTAGDRGYLVYERSYNPSVSPVPTDTWVQEDVGGAFFWSTGGLPDPFAVYNRDLSDWDTILGDGTVLGLSFGIGSGWGPFDGAVDNVTLGRGENVTTWNFETIGTDVPAPGGVPLLLAAIGGLALLRRRASI
jgi:hypothetical protein